MIETALISDLDVLLRLGPAWEALWRRAPQATPFQSPRWLIPWMRHFAPGELRTAVAYVGGELAALLPFYVERGALGRRLLPIGIGITDYLDALVDPRWPEAPRAAARRLVDTEWDEWRFEGLRPGAAALRLESPSRTEASLIEQDACPVLTLRGPELADSVPARQRRKLRRARAVAERRGGVELRDDDPAGGFLDLLLALHRARWRSRGESGVLADPQVEAFHRAALPELQAAGLAVTWTLRIGGRAVGAYYGLRDATRAYAYLGGLDPAFEEASPGALTIEAACAQAARGGAGEFHFLRGRESYKYAWGAEDRFNLALIWRHV